MHFDDRLATVLRLPASGEAMARNQYLQLVDILGTLPADATSPALESGFERIAALTGAIPVAHRARLLARSARPITNVRLLTALADHEPELASAAIASARLSDDDWLALIPALPVRARGILRHRRDLSAPVDALLERLGVHDRALPDNSPVTADAEAQAPANDPGVNEPVFDQHVSDDVLEMLDMAEEADAQEAPQPTSLNEWARARAAQQRDLGSAAPSAPAEAGIGAIVRRIEEFRRARETHLADHAGDAPRLPLGDTVAVELRLAQSIDFATDSEGTISWAEGPYASSVVGLPLVAIDALGTGCDGSGEAIAAAVLRRVPLRSAHLMLSGAPAIAGSWQIDGIPRFEGGRFIGYIARMRRAAAAVPQPSSAESSEGDRLRQVLHELRTPANAIQVAAEIIQQQLYGPAPHEYRALAAAIAGDCAHILAGFEDLERLAKLETGAVVLEEGCSDLAEVLAETIGRLRAWTEPRGSGFALSSELSHAHLPIAIERTEAERLVWRVFAALAGSMAPGEKLTLSLEHQAGALALAIDIPAALAERDPDGLFESLGTERAQSLATGMFGIGFTLRLAAAEARATGGGLDRKDGTLRLTLPALTLADAGNSTALGGAI